MLCRLLLVDDDPAILSALRRELLRPPVIGTDGIEIEGYDHPRDALDRCAEIDGNFDAAIVDFHMPQIDGIAFFEALRRTQPTTIRILLTGEIGYEGAVEAINRGQVDYLLTKPWHEYDLKSRIALALRERATPPRPRATDAPLRIIVADDDPGVRHALERELRRMAANFPPPFPAVEIRLAESGQAALALAGECPPDLVIADYQMPDMDGINCFHVLGQRHPDAVRVLVSGRADTRVLVDAVNIGGVHHFLAKPWEAVELRAILARLGRRG